MVLTISDMDLMRMKAALMDKDRDAALQIIKELVKQLEVQAGEKLKSHAKNRTVGKHYGPGSVPGPFAAGRLPATLFR